MEQVYTAGCVTINTDASYKEGTYGYAFWITYGENKRFFGSGYGFNLKSCHEAEIIAIRMALEKLSKEGQFIRSPWLVINSDSKSAMFAIQKPKKGSNAEKAFQALEAVEYHLQVEHTRFRHVKAHKHTKTKRNWVNDWCDRVSKEKRLEAEKLNGN